MTEAVPELREGLTCVGVDEFDDTLPLFELFVLAEPLRRSPGADPLEETAKLANALLSRLDPTGATET